MLKACRICTASTRLRGTRVRWRTDAAPPVSYAAQQQTLQQVAGVARYIVRRCPRRAAHGLRRDIRP